MAVVVQQMVDSQKSGVLFTVDPVHGRKDRMVVEAARGLGEAVVSGEVTPDHYTLSRDGVVKRSKVVGAERVLSDADCAALAKMGRQLAELHGGPAGHRVGLRRRRPPVPAAVASHHHHLRSAR